MLNNWTEILLLLFGSPVVMTGIAFLAREKIKSAFFVEAHNLINAHKQTLDTYTEAMKHSLQRELVRVEHNVRSKFTIYPKLYAKFIKASGAIRGLWGLSWGIDYSRVTEADLKGMLDTRKVLLGEQDLILDAFKANRAKGIKMFEKMMREIQIQSARVEFQKCKNYLVLNELFISNEINEICSKLIQELASASVTASIGTSSSATPGINYYEGFTKTLETCDLLQKQLNIAMREELEPKGK